MLAQISMMKKKYYLYFFAFSILINGCEEDGL